MRGRDLRLLPLAGAVWGAALTCVFLPALAWPCAAVCATCALAVSAASLWRRRSGNGMGFARGGLVVAMLGAAAATAVTVGFAQPAREEAVESDGRFVELTAEITSSSAVGRDGRLWFEAQLHAIGPPGAPRQLSVPVRVGAEPGSGFDPGARIRVTGEAAAADQGERATLVIFAASAEVEHPASGILGVAAGIRHVFVERAERLPEPGSGLLPGLAVGDTRAVGTALSDDMRASGLSHLTAVSGANCAIVVGAVFWLVALCGGGRMLRVTIAVTALAGFVVLVTPEPSVVRAAVMAAVAMLAVLLGRPSAGAGMLALCAIGILLVDPWLAATPGFALSVAASGALILLAPPLGKGLARWMPHPLALATAVPLAAQLVCGPIIALFAEQQSLIGIAANLLAAPAAPIATVVGLLACLAAPLPWLADVLAASAWLPASWIAATATTTARLPMAQLALAPGIGSAALVAVVSAATALLIVPVRPIGRLDQRNRWFRLVRGGAAGVLVVLTSLGGAHLILVGPLATSTSPDGWSIAACDVGQGDALVVRSAAAVALIDTGPDPGPLSECLRGLGIDRIDLLFLTHFDIDHVGGVDAVQGRVGTVMHGPTAEPPDQRTLDRLASGGAALVPAVAEMQGALGGATFRVLWPQAGSKVFPPGNDASLVVEFEGGGVPRSLFLGDLSAEPQRMLTRTADLSGGYAVVKVAHHGSADQDPGLYEALHPAVAVFSAGVDNDYGHPRKDALSLLAGVGAHVVRTDEQGRILLGLRDGELRVWTQTAR